MAAKQKLSRCQAMEISKLPRKARREDGFAMIEVVVAIFILAVGLLGLAALLAQLSGTSGSSRYMGTQVMLASEKLEDLNRLPSSDAAITAPSGGTSGTIATDSAGYFDQVQISSENGTVATTAGTAASAGSDIMQFKRRWVIEQDPAGLPTGVKRITVWVALMDGDS